MADSHTLCSVCFNPHSFHQQSLTPTSLIPNRFSEAYPIFEAALHILNLQTHRFLLPSLIYAVPLAYNATYLQSLLYRIKADYDTAMTYYSDMKHASYIRMCGRWKRKLLSRRIIAVKMESLMRGRNWAGGRAWWIVAARVGRRSWEVWWQEGFVDGYSVVCGEIRDGRR